MPQKKSNTKSGRATTQLYVHLTVADASADIGIAESLLVNGMPETLARILL
jgi:hypothetical protein